MKFRFTFLAIIAIYLFSFHYYQQWGNGIVGGGDSWGYYLYLPALVIHSDIGDLQTSVRARKSYRPGWEEPADSTGTQVVGGTHLSPIGKPVNRYTMGLAIVYLPFFLLAHLLAMLFGLPSDGYSLIYIYIMHLSSIVYVLLGLYMLSNILKQYFDRLTVSLSLLGIAIGTNLFYFTVYNSCMAHADLFFLYVLLIHLSIRFYKAPGGRMALGIGLTAGLITLTRPSELICILIPILWGISSWADLKARFFFFRKDYKLLLVATLLFVVPIIPQLLYWKYVSGQFIYDSYQGHSFNFDDPALYWGIFQFKNGWLAYTPIMAFALAGIPLLLKHFKGVLLPLLVFLGLHVYVTYSWSVWNYVNGFGSRPMVETYALLSIPLAALLVEVRRSRILAYATYAVGVFLITLNLFQNYQIYKGVLWSEDANWAFYKQVFGKTSLSKQDLLVYDSGESQPDEPGLKLISRVYHNSFDDSTSNYQTSGGNAAYMLDKKQLYSPGFRGTFDQIDARPGDWLKIGVDCMRKDGIGNFYHQSSLILDIGLGKKWRHVKLENKLGNKENIFWGGEDDYWDRVFYYVKVPDGILDSDIIQAFVMNAQEVPIYIDNLSLEVWRETK